MLSIENILSESGFCWLFLLVLNECTTLIRGQSTHQDDFILCIMQSTLPHVQPSFYLFMFLLLLDCFVLLISIIVYSLPSNSWFNHLNFFLLIFWVPHINLRLIWFLLFISNITRRDNLNSLYIYFSKSSFSIAYSWTDLTLNSAPTYLGRSQHYFS